MSSFKSTGLTSTCEGHDQRHHLADWARISWASFPVIGPVFTSMFLAYSSSLSHFGRKNIITGNERFQTIFTHVVQDCYETYPVSFVVIGQTISHLQCILICVIPQPFSLHL